MKFMKYYVESDQGERTKCYYHIGEFGGKKCVYVFATGYDGCLSFLPNRENNSDPMTDYFEKDRAWIYEGHPLYAAALARAEKNLADDRAKRERRLELCR